MMYPTVLENHKSTDSFDFDNEHYHLRQRRAYYHMRDYPILMHTHKFYELNIVTAGEGQHYIEDKSFPTKKGDVFAFPPNVRHGYYAKDNDEMSIFHLLVDEPILKQYSKELNSFPGFRTLFEIEPQIRQQSDKTQLFLSLTDSVFDDFKTKMDELIRIEREGDFIGKDSIMALKMVCLMCDLSRLISTEMRLDSSGPQSQQALCIIKTTEYINANYGKKITLDELSQVALMSRAVFLRMFKNLMGVSPMQYLKQIRVKYAVNMLETTNESITAIALSCGFFDCSHFIRIFQELRGTSPVKYRAQYRETST